MIIFYRFKILFLIFLVFGEKAWAHPQFFRHQYLSCTACHTQSRGGGMLNGYGKGISQAFSLPGGEYETAPWREKISMGEIWDVQAQARVALARKFRPDYERIFPMQADLSALVRPTEKLIVETTLSRSPVKTGNLNNQSDDGLWAHLFFRRALMSFDLSDSWRLLFGRDLNYLGLGIDDHTAYIKRDNRQGVTDFPTQLAMQFNGASTRAHVTVLAPSFQEAEINQEWGLASQIEHALFPNFSLGGHFSKTQSDTFNRDLLGLSSRGAFGVLSSLLQLDLSNRENRQSRRSFIQYTTYGELGIWPVDGVKFAMTGEYLSRHQHFKYEEHRYGPTLWAHLWRHITAQIDARISRGDKREEKSLLGQLYGHFW